MSFARLEPYNALPPVPPQAAIETTCVMRACLRASRLLAELKGRVELLPDPSLLINAIPLQEAQSSSEIENIVTTQDELFQAAASDGAMLDPQTKEVLRYRSALRLAFDHVTERGLTLGLVREIACVLMGQPMAFRAASEQVRLGTALSGHVAYTPPSGGLVVLDKLDNWLAFACGRGEGAALDPLLRMAISHYQFEAIHPFLDGNGRTGRILNLALLVQDGLLTLPVLYLSRYILQHKQAYYDLLAAVTERQAWQPWLLFVLTGIEETARLTLAQLAAVSDLMAQTVVRCRHALPKRVYSKELIELIFRQPYCKVAFVVEAGIAKRQTAATYLQALQSIGVLRGERRGREVIYKHLALVDALGVV
ncbi:MAG: Fic family protein [Polyangiales bacterium]